MNKAQLVAIEVASVCVSPHMSSAYLFYNESLPPSLSILFYESEYLTEPRTQWFSYTGWSHSPLRPFWVTPRAGVVSMNCHTEIFHMNTNDGTWVFKSTPQATTLNPYL